MNSEVAEKILGLTRQFYQTFALPFSNTRMRLQPGVRRILDDLPSSGHILDLGCGNGYLACKLLRQDPTATYTGLDFSPALLTLARRTCPGNQNICFHIADLSSTNWDAVLMPAPDSPPALLFDTILAFAVLHHLPGAHVRVNLLKKVRSLLKPDGQFIHSEWQFLTNPRLRARVQAWEVIGLSEQDVDPGDYLLDWRHGGQGLRYVHHFSESELAGLAAESGFSILTTFYSDGEGGNLGIYQIWQST